MEAYLKKKIGWIIVDEIEEMNQQEKKSSKWKINYFEKPDKFATRIELRIIVW